MQTEVVASDRLRKRTLQRLTDFRRARELLKNIHISWSCFRLFLGGSCNIHISK